MADFYRAFEDRYRGSRDLIKQRLKVYLPFVETVLRQYPEADSLDLGCGRGEWLELLSAAGFKANGVDLDDGMLAACRDRGLTVERKDALTALQERPDSSLGIVSAFHLVEHLDFDNARQLISIALSKLLPGGLLILETPNPENLIVASCDFYLDPTHERPIPPKLLRFAVEHAGFERAKILRLQEPVEFADPEHPVNIMAVLSAVSPDYSVIGRKSGPPEVLKATNALFERSYGLTLGVLSERFGTRLEETVRGAEERSRQADRISRHADEIAQHALEHALKAAEDANNRIDRLEQLHAASLEALVELQAVYRTKSWRLTAPLRWANREIKFIREHGLIKRIKVAIKRVLVNLIEGINQKPRLKHVLAKLVRRLGIANRLRGIYRSNANSNQTQHRHYYVHRERDLPPNAQQIYRELRDAAKQERKAD